MGKASSAKKVARAARAGGRVSAGQPRGLLFPGVLALIVVLGVALVAYARDDRQDQDLGGTPQLEDHIHQAIGFNVCGEWLPDVAEFESPVGIHTHGDGVLHVHPFSQLGTGPNATLERYFKDARDDGGVDLSLSDSKLSYFDEDYEEGDTECEGVDDPQLRMAYWEDVADAEADPKVTTGDFGDLRLSEDGAGITIFYGDPDADIPKPPAGANLAELGAADAAPSTTEEDSSTSTVPDDEGSTSTTAADGGSSSTTAAETTTTAAP